MNNESSMEPSILACNNQEIDRRSFPYWWMQFSLQSSCLVFFFLVYVCATMQWTGSYLQTNTKKDELKNGNLKYGEKAQIYT